MPTPAVSAQEQLMLELINRARLDPQAEAARFGISLNNGLAEGTISSAPKAPLAFNSDLNESAAGHSSWMLAADVFSHTGSGGSNSATRMKNAGYVFTGSWGSGENIAWRGTTSTLNITQSIYEQHKSLFLSAGHRKNTMGDFREIGIAQEIGGFTQNGTTFNSSMITQNFARSGTNAFITGVAYNDLDKDGFYDVGEQRSGIVVDWLGNSGGAVTTAAAGGYAVKIPLGLTGSTNVAVTVGSTVINASLSMTGTNVKLDVLDSRVLGSSTSLTLGSGGSDAFLLGMSNSSLTGNGANNVLKGNVGSNALTGMGGNDTLRGNGGGDRLDGGAGLDTLTGGAGSDQFIFRSTGDSGTTSTNCDIITDFAKGADDIVVSSIDANVNLTGDQAFALDTNGSFSTGEIRQTVTSSGLFIQFNTDSDSTPEMALILRGVTSALAASDFIL
jgi:uncharacterized protein YkwD